jgi:hypothetical protein
MVQIRSLVPKKADATDGSADDRVSSYASVSWAGAHALVSCTKAGFGDRVRMS